MNEQPEKIYEFEQFRVETADKTLWQGQKKIAVPIKAVEILTLLIEKQGRTVSKEEILETVWQDTFVDENNLAVMISTLRKALGERKDENHFIETIPRRGYRFVADINGTKGDLLVERHSITEITIENENLPKTKTGEAKSHPITYSLLTVCAIIAASVFVYSYWFSSAGQSNQKTTLIETKPIQTIAVLPFRSFEIDKKNEQLSLGLTDALITKLANLRGLSVRPTTSVLEYAETSPTPHIIGEKLKVESYLAGTIQRAENRLRISLQLIKTSDGSVMWAGNFDKDETDLLKLQDEISGQIVTAMKYKISPQESQTLARSETQNTDAYELYLKGAAALATSTQSIKDTFQARDYFEQAIRLDSNFALAHAGLARTYTNAASMNLLSPQECYPKAEISARKALEIEPNSALSYVVLGEIETDYNWNWAAGEANFKRALELNPNLASAHHTYAEFLGRMGRFDESFRESELAQQFDPTNINYKAVNALLLFYAHRFDESIAQSKKVLAENPDSYLALLYLAAAHNAKGEAAEAIEAGDKARKLSGGQVNDVLALACSYAIAKNQPKADEMLEKLKTLSKHQYVDSSFFTAIYAVRGEPEKAFEFMEKAYNEKSYWITALVGSSRVDLQACKLEYSIVSPK